MVKMESATAANNFLSNLNLPTQAALGKVSVIQDHTE